MLAVQASQLSRNPLLERVVEALTGFRLTMAGLKTTQGAQHGKA
jgi:hypothetical protein